MIYGVSQTHYTTDYRWLFTGEEIIKQFKERGEQLALGHETFVAFWPFGGSNSSDTTIIRLDSDEKIKEFLVRKEYNNYEDPMLCDISEFNVIVDTDFGSCTQEYLNKFGLKQSDLEQTDDVDKHRENAERMIADIKASGYTDFDYDNPFYGDNSEMRFSELCSLWEQCCGRSAGM